MKKVLTIGSATQDIFIDYKSPQAKMLGDSSADSCSYLLVAEGCKIEVNDLFYTTGGGSTNTAVSFKKLGFDTTSFFQIGDDPESTFIIEQLSHQEISLDYIQKANYKTGCSFILPSPTGNQPILAYRGVNAFLQQDDLPLEKIKDFDLIYITSLSGQSSTCLEPLAKKAHALNILVATNPGKSQLAAGADILKNALPYLSILICNATEAAQLMYSLMEGRQKETSIQSSPNASLPQLLKNPLYHENISCDLATFFKMVHGYGPKTVVVTNGAEGVYVSDAKKIYFQESIPTNIVSTVGAGDAFGSCFVASITQGFSIKQAVQYGITNASSVIGHLGAKEGLLTLDKLEKHLKKNPLKPSQLFDL